MVCERCRRREHDYCDTVDSDKTWCDCQHAGAKTPYKTSDAFEDLRKLALLMERRNPTKPGESRRT
jgi:hypothetical protein